MTDSTREWKGWREHLVACSRSAARPPRPGVWRAAVAWLPIAGLWLSAGLSAQDMEWVRQYGTTAVEYSRGAAVHASSVYVVGYTAGPLDGQVNSGGEDAYLTKLGTDASPQWTRVFGTASYDDALGVTTDSTGVYVAGYTAGSLGGANVGAHDCFVVKYDHDGNTAWSTQFGTSQDDAGLSVCVDAAGIYVVGFTRGTLSAGSEGALDCYVRKLDLGGGELWTRQFGSPADDSASAVVASADSPGIYVAGYVESALPGQTGSGGRDAFVRKYDDGGTELWTRQFGTDMADAAWGVFAGADGVYVGGETYGVLEGPATGSNGDALVRAFDPDGDVRWTRQFGTVEGEVCRSAISGDSSGLWVAGGTRGVLAGSRGFGGWDAFVRRLDVAGNEVWTQQVGTPGDEGDVVVAASEATGLYVAGETNGTFDGQVRAGAEDSFVLKYGTPDCLSSSVAVSLGASWADSLTPGLPSAAFRFRPSAELVGKAAVLTVVDSDSGDENAVYLRWGGCASASRFDLAADGRSRSSQKLAIPALRDEVANVLVQANVFGGGVNDLTLRVDPVDLALESLSARYAGAGGTGRLSLSILGVGFDEETGFRLERAARPSIPAEGVVIVSGSRAEAVFSLPGAEPGGYDLVAEHELTGVTDRLAGAFEVAETAVGPVLEVELDGPEKYRHGRPARGVLRYRNAGDAEMPAPVFKIDLVGEASAAWYLERDRHERTGGMMVVGLHPDGVPGRLPPGGAGEIAVLFVPRAVAPEECPQFACGGRIRVSVLHPQAGDFVGWDEIGPPEGIEAETWKTIWPALSSRAGGSWQEYGEHLVGVATRLSRRGAEGASAREVFRFMYSEAAGRPSSAVLGRVEISGLRMPLSGGHVLALEGGQVVSSALTDPDGAYALEHLAAGGTYELRVDDHRIEETSTGSVEISTGSASVTLPADADLLNVSMMVKAEADTLEPVCPRCEPEELPEDAIVPPESLFRVVSEREIQVVSAWDPNDKESPTPGSDGDEGGILGVDSEIYYTIYFENKKEADVAADRVTIEDLLDPALDASTLRFRDYRIGSAPEQLRVLDVKGTDRFSGFTHDPGLSRYDVADRIDVRHLDSAGELVRSLPVDFRAGTSVDESTGRVKVTWEFTTLTDDPLVGFLLPNVDRGEGEGYVSFSIFPRKDVADGELIENTADILFDHLERTGTVRHKILRPGAFPGAFSLLLPAEGQEDVAALPVLEWEESSLAEGYAVFLWEAGRPRPAEGVEIKRPPYLPGLALAPETEYRWQVVARNGRGEAWSEERGFRTLGWVGLPASPTGPFPPDGHLVRRPPELSWGPASGAGVYDVYVWKAPGVRPSEAVARGLAGRRLALSSLEDGATYLWQVEARNGEGSTAGPVWGFSTRAEEAAFRRGDCNGDGEVNISDPIYLLGWLFLGGGGLPCEASGDGNADDGLNISDSVYLLGFLFLGGPEPAAPFAACGPRPEGSALSCDSWPPCQ